MSSPRPIAHHHLVKAHIHIHTLQFIASLLLTLMLLWHISTITLVENYQMPAWWVRDFLAEHANGWRVGVWSVVGVFVVADCAVALLELDWWWRMSEQCRAGLASGGEADQRHQQSSFSGHTHAESPLQALRARLSSRLAHQTRIFLLGAFDLLMLAVLASHSVTYFVSLPTALTFCSLPAVLESPGQEFGEEKVPLSVQNRCIGLNVDIHVAGGFAVFMALVLSMLHVATLVLRGWEGARGEKRVATRVVERRQRSASSILGSKKSRMSVSQESKTPPGSGQSSSDSIGVEERSTGIRSVNRSDEATERVARQRAAPSGGALSWSEVLLECLIDA